MHRDVSPMCACAPGKSLRDASECGAGRSLVFGFSDPDHNLCKGPFGEVLAAQHIQYIAQVSARKPPTPDPAA